MNAKTGNLPVQTCPEAGLSAVYLDGTHIKLHGSSDEGTVALCGATKRYLWPAKAGT
jgi:hypothetical protein